MKRPRRKVGLPETITLKDVEALQILEDSGLMTVKRVENVIPEACLPEVKPGWVSTVRQRTADGREFAVVRWLDLPALLAVLVDELILGEPVEDE